MPSDLERIEEKHRESPGRGADGTGYCYEDDLPYPCDVVKLARALRAMLLSADCSWESGGAGHDWPETCEAARRVLREVAPNAPGGDE